ncbi:dihydropteroate synthase [Algihabitans albus]|uniref:dihydropteroate synthase n=1 Tax=Algihabitans albus TaxID=2164067 RepID=UPI000E5C9D81|nr:dihydropteroate synthase [Algihabitans albus]
MSLDPYILPTALTSQPLHGGLSVAGRLHAAAITLLHRDRPDETLSPLDLPPGLAARAELLSAPRPAFAGLSLERPLVMGVINVTPDSFSDGGDRLRAEQAISEGLAMADAGAAILDVGGESTRPGAQPVPVAEELHRVLPVIEALAGRGLAVSVDTRRPEVMRAAAAAGARILNDVTALTGDPESLETAAELGLPVVLMHMQGEPQTMQRAPTYAEVALDVFDALEGRVEACLAAGIPRERLAVDPGIGFGKTLAHNLHLLDNLALFHGLGCPLLLGVSRKSFIAKLMPDEGPPPKQRLPGSLAAALAGVQRGAQILRVHDVAETCQALAVWQAIASADGGNFP